MKINAAARLTATQIAEQFLDKLQPSKEVKEGSETAYFNKFGAAVAKLVKKYEAHNAANRASPGGIGSISHVYSGELVFARTKSVAGGRYSLDAYGYFAVQIGSAYPKDQALAFAKEYAKLVKTTLPMQVPVKGSDGNKTIRPTRIYQTTGTAYHLMMVTFGVAN